MTSSAKTHRPSQPILNWLTRSVPNFFDQIFEGLGRYSLLWIVGILLLLSVPLIVTQIETWQQVVVAFVLILLGWLIVRMERHQVDPKVNEYLHLFMVWLSVITTFRYFYYRTSYTLNFDGWVNTSFSLLVYGAELYALIGLLLAYFQTLKLKHRRAVPLDQFPQERWFSVDVYILTYNEDVDIVRKTALAAAAMDYPANKKRVYVLDDGRMFPERRQQLKQMCQEVGCTLLTRDNNDYAKAGNINNALQKTKGDLVLILDCDHIPAQGFLKNTVGFFYKPDVFLVQTPHWFYNPDPFERNLRTKGRVPVSNELFYKVVQKGNDFWNAAFFCGSAGILRKDYLMEAGGIAVETVTEDCHTSFRLHSQGYSSVYYDKIMIAGLAPEKFSALVGQQVRWARGMAQILRLENPLFNTRLNLSMPQRLCYFSAMFGFFYGVPRLMYAIAPTLFLLFGINPIRGLGLETLAYAVPYIILAMYANYIISKRVRFSFWNEVYEFALSFYTAIATMKAVISPGRGRFNVTDKQLSVNKRSFDWQSARPLVVLTVLVVASLIAVPFWLLSSPEKYQAILTNAIWSGFNLLLLGGALIVAFEQPQMRRAHRLQRELLTTLYSQNQTWQGKTVDVSETGARIILDSWPNIPDVIEIELAGDSTTRVFLKAEIVRVVPLNENQTFLIVEFLDLTQEEKDALSLLLYSDVKEWYGQKREILDDPLESLGFIASSFTRSFKELKPTEGVTKLRKRVRTPGQFFWEGQFYPAVITEVGSQSLQVTLDASLLPNWETMQHRQPVAGLLLNPDSNGVGNRLLALIESTKIADDNLIIVELRLPASLKRRQERSVKRLLEV
ncbi:MAG: glycosyltransferase family 2 protein [Leptolyngbyaceae cyanobacterium]